MSRLCIFFPPKVPMATERAADRPSLLESPSSQCCLRAMIRRAGPATRTTVLLLCVAALLGLALALRPDVVRDAASVRYAVTNGAPEPRTISTSPGQLRPLHAAAPALVRVSNGGPWHAPAVALRNLKAPASAPEQHSSQRVGAGWKALGGSQKQSLAALLAALCCWAAWTTWSMASRSWTERTRPSAWAMASAHPDDAGSEPQAEPWPEALCATLQQERHELLARQWHIDAVLRPPGLAPGKSSLIVQFLTIAVPAFVQLTAEPLAGLIDTVYLGRLGAEVLGGVGVAISAYYAVSKLYNDPLLRSSISLVAAQDGRARGGDGARELSAAVTTALLLALVVGGVQAAVYGLLTGPILSAMGVPGGSPMRQPALSYLRVRALGAPTATLWLVANGVFRGLGDTATPLTWALVFTALNAALDPLFIFGLGFGAAGAAAGTALAQTIALAPLLWTLHRRVGLRLAGQLPLLLRSLRAYLEAGVFVLGRTWAKVLAYTACGREAALLGPVAAAAYSLTFQLGVATTQVCESIAIAAQTLLAREVGDAAKPAGLRAGTMRRIIQLAVGSGGAVTLGLTLLTWNGRVSVLQGLTTDAAVRAAAEAVFPVVMLTQVFKGLAYPVNGVIMGGLDWGFSMVTMWLANAACLGVVYGRVPCTLQTIWLGLALLMGVQVVAGLLRVVSGTGVWGQLRAQA